MATVVETPDVHGAFPRLGEDKIAMLEREGERRDVEAGQVLFQEGERDYPFVVVLSGLVAVVSGYPVEERPIAVHGPGRFLGELSLITGETAYFTAIAREPGEVLVVPPQRLRELVVGDDELGDLVLRAYVLRRELLIGLGAGLKIIGSHHSRDTLRLREFAVRNRVPHRWIDVEEDADAEALLSRLGVSPEETPVVIEGEKVLRNPSNAELARAIGLRETGRSSAGCDLIVVGAGPAGLAAAVYGASEGLDTRVLDAVAAGGQAATSPRIENYLGFPSGISGSELAERAIVQARKFGADLGVPSQASALWQEDGQFIAGLDDGTEMSTRTVVIATGARYRRLPVERLEEFEGTSVFYAATRAEAMMCSGDPVVVVGGGNSAAQAALSLSRDAARVRLLVRHADLGKDMSRYLIDRLERSDIVEVCVNTDVRELVGHDGHLEAVGVVNTVTGEAGMLEARALFVFIGARPHTDWLGDLIQLDDHGFICTGAAAGRTGALETSSAGVFAAGDVRSGSIKRVASAVGEGAMAVRFVHAHLAGGSV